MATLFPASASLCARALLACVLAAGSCMAMAQQAQPHAAHAASAATPAVEARNPWVRATVAGQMATGAFMDLSSTQDLQLVAARSPGIAVVEIHEMTMEGGVMKMRAIKALPVPAGQTTALKPGGYHIMLMDLKAPLHAGATLPMTLVFKDAQGKTLEQTVQAPVRMPGAAAAKADAAAMHQHHATMQ